MAAKDKFLKTINLKNCVIIIFNPCDKLAETGDL